MNKTGDMVKAKLMEKVSEGGEISEYETGWANSVISFSDGLIHVMLKYNFAYRAKRKNGEMAKNLTRLDTKIKMTYCPFCGEKQV